ncbi:hypothetical protein [Dokdonia sp.]|uniref:hypothetical protein n=1 Tax=Dokdonia sp. TaxID=2024995 RepID=UPI003263D1DA
MQLLNHATQKNIKGGTCPLLHIISTQEGCESCGGNWSGFGNSGLCELPINHFCQ